MSKGVTGKIHSIETFGAVDGPGVRFVLFVQGCPLKCLYCHNPDSWCMSDGKSVNSDDIVKQIKSYRNFIKNGGVTISGGEPLMQHEFVLDIVKKCKDIGLHTAIDTAGSVPLKLSKKVIDESDLLLLDIKALDNDVCIKLTGSDNKNTLETLDYCEKTKKPVWIRHVLVPSITLDEKMLIELAEFLKKYTVIENIELLPFHKMGEFKWEELNMKYELYDTPQPQPEEIKMAKDIFVSRGLPVR